jgi:hypothetical protein
MDNELKRILIAALSTRNSKHGTADCLSPNVPKDEMVLKRSSMWRGARRYVSHLWLHAQKIVENLDDVSSTKVAGQINVI